MAWNCFDYCQLCDGEHSVYIDQHDEPEPKATLQYRCPRSGLPRLFRYSPMCSEPVPAIPAGAIVARRAAPPSSTESLVIEAAGTAVSLHISCT